MHSLIALLFTLSSFHTMIIPEKQTLNITFKGYTEVKGNIMFKVVDENNKEIVAKLVEVDKTNQTVSLMLPQGKFAISAFHDANGNKKLDKNIMGLPTEKYGFSNDARGTFGPPSLASQLFEVGANTDISITLK